MLYELKYCKVKYCEFLCPQYQPSMSMKHIFAFCSVNQHKVSHGLFFSPSFSSTQLLTNHLNCTRYILPSRSYDVEYIEHDKRTVPAGVGDVK